MSVSKEGTWDCVRVEEMRAFPSSQPVQAASPGIHGPPTPPTGSSTCGGEVGGGGWGDQGSSADGDSVAPGNALLACFLVFSAGLRPRVACCPVQARPCEPSGLLARRPSLWPFLPRRRWSHLPELDARHRSKKKRTKQTSSAFLICKDAFLTQSWVLNVVALF